MKCFFRAKTSSARRVCACKNMWDTRWYIWCCHCTYVYVIVCVRVCVCFLCVLDNHSICVHCVFICVWLWLSPICWPILSNSSNMSKRLSLLLLSLLTNKTMACPLYLEIEEVWKYSHCVFDFFVSLYQSLSKKIDTQEIRIYLRVSG